MKYIKISLLILASIVLVAFTFCSEQKATEAKVTFIELGSVKCIPCKKMQKVIKQVEINYPTEVECIFYDVWTDEGEEAAKDFEFDLIPTQIFLDKNGKEYARHEGYLPYEDLEKILKTGIRKY